MNKLAIVVALLFLVACVETRTIPQETHALPAKPDNYPIEILDPVSISKPYKVIGVAEVNAGKNHSPAATIENLKQEARKMGGEALIGLKRCAEGGIDAKERWSAKVIVWQ
jgi:hypothetical protein